MLGEEPRRGGQFGQAPHANREFADRPGIRQRDDREGGALRRSSRGGFGHDADSNARLDEAAHAIKASQLNAEPDGPAESPGLPGEKALQSAGAIEPDDIVIEDLGEAHAVPVSRIRLNSNTVQLEMWKADAVGRVFGDRLRWLVLLPAFRLASV